MSRIKRRQALQPSMPARFRNHIRPANMSKIEMSHEQKMLFERLALEIFTDCSNAGCTFGQTLSAILVSGMDWGIISCGTEAKAS